MEKALQLFYYQFHTRQHYFLCHDILEDAWKENPNFSKNDAVVSLILMTTGCYHYRRNNFRGAKTSFDRALNVIQSSTDKQILGLDIDKYVILLNSLKCNAMSCRPFLPIRLPLKQEMLQAVQSNFTDFSFRDTLINDSYIVNHHLERDRSEVIDARYNALITRRLNREE
ncbi:DUF309 domain-containing protein [Staphylococcus gallinarum]|uniref:DUF309 domain-containing protein n=1 Tax=Staphylococcus gallinarum TaxID=1293 RepID=A0A3A0VJW6_STAGA|nr:DUF309 domain-containing protein [Staphylococcus gallinarum]RIP34280.1 DUF309 domain-containing protein [Staphylococcus gallinarum]